MNAFYPSSSQDLDARFNPDKVADGYLDKSQNSITFESLDVKEEIIDKLFETAKKSLNDTIAHVSIDRKKAREIRKAQKKAHKEEVSQKCKIFYQCVIPKMMQLKGDSILKICFSQDSIDSKTRQGMTLDQLKESMASKGWLKGSQITVIKMPDNTLVSADNRRLYAAKKVAEQSRQFTITLNLYHYADMAPSKFVKGIESEYKKARNIERAVQIDSMDLPSSIQLGTYGYAMVLRINTRNGELKNSHFGYEKYPIVR